MSLTPEDLKTLAQEFDRNTIGVKIQSFNKERTRATLVLYIQHTDVASRLDSVDAGWTFEILADERVQDKDWITVYVRGRMKIKGVVRENIGEGGDPKSAASDCLKRCAMLFGIGRYLYDSETVWIDYSESNDRWRSWTYADYEAALNKRRGVSAPASQGPAPQPKAAATKPTIVKPVPQELPMGTRGRDELNRILMNLYRPYLAQFPETQFAVLLGARYGLTETRLMTVEQLEDLVQYMESQLRSVS